MSIDPGFRGEIAGYYARYRRGYPATVVDAIAAAFDLGPADTVLDLGCGTGEAGRGVAVGEAVCVPDQGVDLSIAAWRDSR
jgi:cyclopropane fatty-acyl-phospholipid synthase-like methyltransferase